MKKYKENRPWGRFEQFCKNEVCSVKILYIKAGQELSLQYHEKRDEFIKVLSGTALVALGTNFIRAGVGRELFVVRCVNHRFAASCDGDVRILEISFGEFDEKDIVRLEDRYGRIKK